MSNANPSSSSPPAAASARSRIDVWKERLLDLSLRNRLIHFTPSRAKSIEFGALDLAALEDRLAQRKSVAFDAAPADELDPARTAARLDAGHVATVHAADDLKARLVQIHRQARTEIDESGASTLYLALGVLHWFEEPDSLVERRAPLLL